MRDGFQIPTDEFEKLLTPITSVEACNINQEYVQKVREVFPDARFYSCKALSEGNKCTLEKKPAFCGDFPCSPLAIIPDECGYTGEIFMKNEELKRKIRKIKEEILDYETLIEIGDKDSNSYKRIVDNLKKFIQKYADFGANDW